MKKKADAFHATGAILICAGLYGVCSGSRPSFWVGVFTIPIGIVLIILHYLRG